MAVCGRLISGWCVGLSLNIAGIVVLSRNLHRRHAVRVVARGIFGSEQSLKIRAALYWS